MSFSIYSFFEGVFYMKSKEQLFIIFILIILIQQKCSSVHSGTSVKYPAVTAPPQSFFEKVRERDRKAAKKFYKKYIDIKGMPVVASAEVADLALGRTYEIVTHMLAGRPDILKGLVERGMYLVIIGADQVYTDLPENRNARNPDYLNERVRGTGGFPTSFGEENLLSMPIDRYDDESIAVHEFCHTIDSTLRRINPTWRDQKNAVYRNAVKKGLYKDTYAISNSSEYWCEIAQAYFDCNRVNNWNHGPIGRREQLKIYDSEGYELVRSTFNLGPDQDWRYSWLQTLPNVEKPPAKFRINPYYTKFTWAREFTVLGHRASDEALLKANDIIRRMFAYRHDILKALIADGVKLVVLGPEEGLSDLPEYKQKAVENLDHTARFMEYSPQTKLMVVAQENVLGDLNDPYTSESQLIRVFAKALYYVTGTRPVDPNWENRGRNVQQYELRIQRMDIRFDQKLKGLYEKAMNGNLWKGTNAVHNHVEYWTMGVLTYFDATGGIASPNDADHPITTREMLKEYDSGLFALVEETMAYKGKVDWRYGN
jgi:alpha-glucosidase